MHKPSMSASRLSPILDLKLSSAQTSGVRSATAPPFPKATIFPIYSLRLRRRANIQHSAAYASASASATHAWLSLIPESQKWDDAAACIGETTAIAAKRLG